MSNKIVGLKYSGTALPTGATTVVLFATAAPSAGVAGSCPMANWAPMNGLHVFRYSIKHSQAITVKGYYKRSGRDSGTGWIQFYDSGSLAAPTYTSSDVVSVEGYPDFKFESLNGGVDQATFEPVLSMSDVP